MFWNRQDRTAERLRKVFARCSSSFQAEAEQAARMAKTMMHERNITLDDLLRGQAEAERSFIERNFRHAQRIWKEMDERERDRVLEALGADAIHFDQLARSLEMDAGKLSGILLELELTGRIRQHAGKHFSLREETSATGQERKTKAQNKAKHTDRREQAGDARHARNGKVWVSSYVRADGRRVRAHWRARRGEAKPKEAWRSDSTASPGEGYQWIAGYIRRNGVEVHGHWRKRPKPAQQKA